MARLGPLFDPENPPEKVIMWVPFLRPFPGNETLFKFFLGGGQNGGFWVGPKSLC